jgi:hypothetical protein
LDPSIADLSVDTNHSRRQDDFRSRNTDAVALERNIAVASIAQVRIADLCIDVAAADTEVDMPAGRNTAEDSHVGSSADHNC